MHDLIDWPFGDGLEIFTREARWFSAIDGGVLAGFSALFYL